MFIRLVYLLIVRRSAGWRSWRVVMLPRTHDRLDPTTCRAFQDRNVPSRYSCQSQNSSVVDMRGVQNQHDELSLVDAEQYPAIADPDPRDVVSTSDHLRPGRAGIRGQRIDGLTDPAAHRLVQRSDPNPRVVR
jgi:hypothetical protein